MLYLKSCSLSGLWHSCLECKYYPDPLGCKQFQDAHKAIIVYPRLNDNFEKMIIREFLENAR